MLIQRANQYRLELTSEQAETLAEWVGACRFVYNSALEQRRDWYRHGKFSFAQQCRELTDCRAAFDWLAAVPSQALQQALHDLDAAYQLFFAGRSGYPRLRRKDGDEGFRLPEPRHLGFKRLSKRMGAVKVPKLGWLKVRNWRPLGGELRSVTIRRKAGHWYASIRWQREVGDPPQKNGPTVGVDRGVALFAALSDGTRVESLHSFRSIEKRLAKLQRRMSRKQKFSANWIKQKAKISRLYSHAANARKDFLHKQSTIIAESQGVVKIERLNVRGMSASAKGTVEEPGRKVRAKSGLNKSILDQGWHMFKTMLAYKLAERGGRLEEVPAAYTSQTCAECGVVDRESRKDQATFECGHCGHADNADVNAARNILQARALAVEPPKRILRRVGKRKQKQEVSS